MHFIALILQFLDSFVRFIELFFFCDQAIVWIYGGMQPAVFLRRAGCIA